MMTMIDMSMKNMNMKNSKAQTGNTRNKKASPNNRQAGALKMLLLTGSMIATLAGTRLLAWQEAAAIEIPVSTTESVTVTMPAVEASSIPLPPTNRGTQIELKPIPQAVLPQIKPVARTRSSR